MNLEFKNILPLDKKIVAIAGGGGELCGTIPEEMAGLGTKVTILNIDIYKAKFREEAILKANEVPKAFKCDVLDETELKSTLKAVAELLGEPDILINGSDGNDPAGCIDRNSLGGRPR